MVVCARYSRLLERFNKYEDREMGAGTVCSIVKPFVLKCARLEMKCAEAS
jgi:hypothetical protein